MTIPLLFLIPFSQQLDEELQGKVNERKGLQMKSNNSQAFQQETLKTLQSHCLWATIALLVIPALRLNNMYLGGVFGFEDFKGERIPHIVGNSFLVVHHCLCQKSEG